MAIDNSTDLAAEAVVDLEVKHMEFIINLSQIFEFLYAFLGDRGNRGGGYSSYYRGASNGPYRGGSGGGGGGDRERQDRDSRHGSFGSSVGSGGGSYQSRVNGPHQHHHHGNGNSSTTSPAPDFDLQAVSSFPPLPGLEAGAPSGASLAVSSNSAGIYL